MCVLGIIPHEYQILIRRSQFRMNTNLRLYGCSLFGLAQGKEEVDEEMFFVLLRRDKDEQKKKRIECNVFCQTQSKSKDKDDEMKTCMFLVWFLTRAFIGGLRACSLFGWIHHGRKMFIH